MSGFWTEEDESRLRAVRAEHEALLTRRSGARSIGPLGAGAPIEASTIYNARRLREACFPSPDLLFGEPAWDMLLDLHSARERRQPVSLSSACLGARIPGTTGRRWLKVLEALGLVERGGDPADGRAQVVALTDDALRIMGDYLDRLSG